ncbi:hypothetical protein L1987_26429 [Smallanthus sonchifolius]|uniref:Uncharacterized protein n=1 Tax=Smallanthus sonchifolius TaxID=185202 RepID=A0ACB9IAV0_9ASTR|nr:hypothetical protein L1987_26429 [Smallanthus sonchifolius]
MGCISSKSSNHQQPNVQVIIPNPYSLSLVHPSNTNHAIDHVPPKQDDTLIIHTNTNLKTNDTLERCSSFHTVEEYDELLQRINNYSDAELAGVPVPETTDSTCKNDRNTEMGDTEKQDMEFQTVASLRQWLHAPGGGRGDADVATIDYTNPRVGFSFYENNINNIQGPEEKSVLVKTGKQEEEESIVELVAAFDEYMQKLQIDEENILKQIHNMIS